MLGTHRTSFSCVKSDTAFRSRSFPSAVNSAVSLGSSSGHRSPSINDRRRTPSCRLTEPPRPLIGLAKATRQTAEASRRCPRSCTSSGHSLIHHLARNPNPRRTTFQGLVQQLTITRDLKARPYGVPWYCRNIRALST